MISAMVLLNTERGRVNEVAERLAELAGITEVFSVAGRHDLVAILRVKDNVELADLVTRHMLLIPPVRAPAASRQRWHGSAPVRGRAHSLRVPGLRTAPPTFQSPRFQSCFLDRSRRAHPRRTPHPPPNSPPYMPFASSFIPVRMLPHRAVRVIVKPTDKV